MKTNRLFIIIAIPLAIFILFAWGLIPAFSSPSATIIVNGTGDTIADDGICILREAVINANEDNQDGSIDCAAGSGTDTITFNLPPGSVISVTNQTDIDDEIAITNHLAISGPGAARLSITQDNSHNKRLFHVQTGISFTITDITLRDIQAPSQNGIVILNDGGDVTVQRVHFRDNQTTSSGGAIQSINNGSLAIADSEFHHNAASSSSGGALYLDTDAVIQNSLFYSNTSSNGGGAIYISHGITVTIQNSVFHKNLTGNDGGAINNHGANTIISGTTFQDNVCDDCEGGAIANFGILTLTNSTLSGNSARSGGGIYDNSYSLEKYATTLIHTTIVNNSSDPDKGGGLYIREGGSSAMLNFQMYASIVANNSGGNDCDYLDWPGIISSNGHNIVESGCEALFNESTDLLGIDPNLGPLQNNGGIPAPQVPPFTHALLTGSQAIDHGGCDGSLVTRDQRHAARPVGAACDAGAYEFGGTPPDAPPVLDKFVYLPMILK